MSLGKTLQSEIRDLCKEFCYPTHWPRHSRCPCCQSESMRPFFSKWEMAHAVCRDCKFVFMNPYPNDEFLDRLYNASYIKSVRTFIEMPKARAGRVDALNGMRPEYYQEIIDFIAQRRVAGRWLDVGGGIGHFLHRVREQFPEFETYLNEMSQVSGEFARDFYRHRLLTQPLAQLVSSGRRFDVITILAVLEHMPHPRPVVQQLVDLLNPGGILLINVPHFSRLNRWLSHADCGGVTAPYHLCQFNWKSFPLLFKAHDNVEPLALWDSGPQAFYWMHLARIVNHSETVIPTKEMEQYESRKVADYSPQEVKRIGRMSYLEQISWLRSLIIRFDGRVYLNCAVQKKASSGAMPAPPQARAA